VSAARRRKRRKRTQRNHQVAGLALACPQLSARIAPFPISTHIVKGCARQRVRERHADSDARTKASTTRHGAHAAVRRANALARADSIVPRAQLRSLEIEKSCHST
jgi:hypothetical protein